MASSSPGNPAERGAREPILTRAQIWFLSVTGLLLALCIAFAWTSGGTVRRLPGAGGDRKGRSAALRTIVDLSTWQTAEALAQMAVTAEEKAYAQQAERLADHSVDQAFAAALREENLDAQNRKLSGEALAITQRIQQLQQLVAQDQAAVKQLGGGQAAAESDDSDNTDVKIAKAQLQLDSDELEDAQDDLDRATGDERPQIRGELAAHEAEMKKYDSGVQQQAQFAAQSVGRYQTLYRRMGAWNRQRARLQMLEDAQRQTEADVTKLTAVHDALAAKLKASATDTAGGQQRGARLAQIQSRSLEQQLLSIYDDRILTEQQLAGVYQKWAAQVQVQHRIVLSLVLISLAWVLAILVCMVLGVALVRRLLEYPAVLDRRQKHTLRSVVRLFIHLVGAVCILLVIFGIPEQTATMLGLATAALTVALGDFILAFLGWFVLIGSKGMRVGDTVEIDGVGGEVVEIGLLSTTLLETGALEARGLPTGRRISLLNNFAIKGKYFNFSTSGQWMWDQFEIAVPASAHTHLIAEQIQAAVEEETAEDTRLAEREWSHARAVGLNTMQARATVNLRPVGNDFNLEVRYVTRAAQRFQLRNRLYRRVVEVLQKPAAGA